MSSAIHTNKCFQSSKWLIVSNLPDKATEETIKTYFERYGQIRSIKIDEQHTAYIHFLNNQSVLKANLAESILDKQHLRTEIYDGSNSILKSQLLETSPVTSSIVEPSSSSPSSVTTVINTLTNKSNSSTHENRDKRISRISSISEEHTRHQVVPIKNDSDSSGSKQKTSIIHSKSIKMKSTRRKHENSSTSSERSDDDILSSKHYRHYSSNLKRQSSSSKTRILKISHLPPKLSTQVLCEALHNLLHDFKRSSHLLKIKIFNDYAFLIFLKSDDIDKALLFLANKTIHGVKLKAEAYDESLCGKLTNLKSFENDDYDLDEYSIKATRTLYVGNLQSEISYQELRDIYSIYGEIIEIEIKRQQSQHSQNFAFIQYADIKSVVKALKSKLSHDHSIKLGFGKSQPTNVLWIDELPLNITELILRSYLYRLTNFSSNDILDIYIDNRMSQKNSIAQCLVYFKDAIAAQTAICLIRGKRFDSKRLQVDFASRVFLTKFSDIIEETNQKKNNDRWANQSYRRYSKVSDTPSSIIRNPIRRHSSSSSSSSSIHSSINRKKIIKSDVEKHASTERIVDWLMQNSHTTVNEDEEEEEPVENRQEQVSNVPIIDTKKTFKTKTIPLESNCSANLSDIRLKIESSFDLQSMLFRIPNFAKKFLKSSTHSNVLNPKAHLKSLLNDSSIKQEDLLIHKQLDERIKLLDQQIDQINRNQTLQIPSVLMPSATMQTSLLPSVPPLSSSIINEKLTLPSVNPLEKLNPTIKFEHKTIPSSLLTITNSSNLNESSVSLTQKVNTSINRAENHAETSSVTTQRLVNNTLKPPVLKSILKQPSFSSSSSTTNEIRKAVHIVSTDSSSERITTRTVPLVEKEKSTNPPKTNKTKTPNMATKISLTKSTVATKSTIKSVKKTLPTSVLIKTSKPESNRHEINKSSATSKVNFQKLKIIPMQNDIFKFKQQNVEKTILVSNIKKSISRSKQDTYKSAKKSEDETTKSKQTTCMYDRIKERARNSNLPSVKVNQTTQHANKLKRQILSSRSSESEKKKSMKTTKSISFDSNIFDTEENDSNKHRQDKQIVGKKFNKQDFILKKTLKTRSHSRKRQQTDESHRSSKKIKLDTKAIEQDPIKSEISSNTLATENQLPSTMDTIIDEQAMMAVIGKEELVVEKIEIKQEEQIQLTLTKSTEQTIVIESECVPELTLPPLIDDSSDKTLKIIPTSPIIDIKPSDLLQDSQTNPIDQTLPIISFETREPSHFLPPSSSSITISNESMNESDSRPAINLKHPTITPIHSFAQIPTPDSTVFTPHQQYLSYPFFTSSLPDSPPLSTRTRSTSSCSSIIGNPLYSAYLSSQQYSYDKDSGRESISKLSTTSSQYPSSDSISSFRVPSDHYNYPYSTPQILNSFSNDYYPLNDIHWEGNIILKTDHAYIRTQLIAGNCQIAHVTMNYWNSSLNHNLRISQRMRLEEIQLDGVKKHMQMDSDYCLLIAQANGLTPDEIRLEQNHLKYGVMQYLNEKKAAGILNILLPGVIQPVYVAHIFPPCPFASEILQQRAPDAYRCVVQNKLEQIYLLFIITSTIQ